jgi:glycerophosphoryl diester phosphodiesterase
MAIWTYPKLIVHRCGGALAPENTLVGLRIAARLGCRAVEFDAMLCADGVPVLIHDETLERTTDGRGEVAAARLPQLRRLDAGFRHAPAFRGEPLPTLAEALDCCAAFGLAANVEIKPAAGHEAATGHAVARLAAAGRYSGQVLLSSFSEEALGSAAAAAPDLPRALLVEDIPADWLPRLRRHGAVALHCAAEAAGISAVRTAGYAVACYTVNAREVADRLIAAGACAVFSDRPDLFEPENKAVDHGNSPWPQLGR